jgi:hypothetical protein
LSSVAVRWALARARCEVTTIPNASTTAPHPARTHHPARLATAKSMCTPPVDRADFAGDQRPDDGHPQGGADLAGGGGDGGGHAGLGPWHARDGRVRDGRVHEAEPDTEDHVGREQPGERGGVADPDQHEAA